MLESILDFDERVFLYLNNLGSDPFDWIWMGLTNILSNVTVYILCFIYLTYKLGIKQSCLILGVGLLLILATDQSTNFFKDAVQRLRPCHEPSLTGLVRLVKETCGGKYGFFSGHASNSFGLALFFGLVIKKYSKLIPILLMIIAFLIAYSRVYIGVHYPIDIIIGGAFGSLYGYLFFRLYRLIQSK
ncbi:MAG: phosphatase PAP2 family protein [Flavobacteriaceae bacterium]|nr:phosphatase PAP2 family protein [Flavobacteriaceae bacterium]MCY4267327.1 phosphatase PAP2 family protein [Flavobacteriaceae bacterium]